MALKGNIKDFRLEEILRFVNAGKKTGALEVSNGVQTVVFYFKNGNLYFIYNSQRPYSVTESVLKQGIVDNETAKEIKAGKKFPLDSINLSEEARKKIKDILMNDLTEVASTVFTWDEGNFVFKANEKRTGEDWGIGVDLEKFLESIKKHSDVFLKFSKIANSLNAKLYLNTNINPDEDIIISGKEWKFISLFKSGTTVEEVAKKGGFSLPSAIAIATSLIEKGLINATTKEENVSLEEEVEVAAEKEASKEEQKQSSEEIKEEGPILESVDVEKDIHEKEDNLLDELAAITGKYEIEGESDETKKELENILKTLKEL